MLQKIITFKRLPRLPKKMKILLITPPYFEEENIATPKKINTNQGYFPPLGLAYIAAVLEKEDYDVKILDAPVLGYDINQIKEFISKENPDVVGIQTLTGDLPSVLKIAKAAKEVNPSIKVVLGGAHLSIFPKESLSFDFVDYGLQGEAEYSFRDLVKHLEGKKDINDIDGLVYKKNGEIIVKYPPAVINDLDELPWPARHLLPMDKYQVVVMEPPIATLVSARGCPFRCNYCCRDKFTYRYRVRDYKNVVDEIEFLKSKYKIKTLSFYDNCYPNKEHIKNICNELIRRKVDIKWETPQRVDLVDPDLLRLMKKSGCYRLRYGVESGSPKILKIMKKDVTVEQIEKAFYWTRKAGIETFAFFMVGYPHETLEDYKGTINLAKRIKADWAYFSVTTPLPATDLWRIAIEDYGMDKDYWHNWALGIRDKHLGRFNKDAEKLCSKAYTSFYFRPYIFYRRLLSLRSLDQIKMYWRGFKTLLSINI